MRAIGVGVVIAALAGMAMAEEVEMVQLKIENLRPPFGSRTLNIGPARNLEPPREGKPYPLPLVPKGCDQLLSWGCKVTSSDPLPLMGKLSMLTDGKKEECDGVDMWRRTRLVLNPGLQWVQIDLGEQKEIYAVCIWHLIYFKVFRDVIVLVSDGPDFVDGVVTLFNNDHDNSVGFGKGKDFEYIETGEGRPIAAEGVKGRYVRCYNGGAYSGEGASYIQVEVFGRK